MPHDAENRADKNSRDKVDMVMVKLVVDPPPPVCRNRTHQLSCVKVVMLIQIEAEVDPNQSLAFGTALEMIKTRSFFNKTKASSG